MLWLVVWWCSFVLLPCSCLVAAPATTLVSLPPGSQHSLVSHVGALNFTGPGNTSWLCPQVDNLEGVSCICDLPHTLRCRGYSDDDTTVLSLTRSLVNAHVSLLDLSIHHVRHLPNKVFNGLQLLGLVLSSAEISKLTEGTFGGLEGSLAALGLPANTFTEVPLKALRALTRLQRLDLSDNHIEELSSRAFPTLIQLHSLSMAGNKVRLIQPEAFVKLPQLRTLNLARNQLDASQISERTLWGLHVLRELILQRNLLKGSITSDFISGAPTLTYLDLSYNALTSIAMGALKSYQNLKVLDLSHNVIDVIEDHSLRHLPNLEELILSHNHVVAISGWSFAHVPKLTTLRLADNSILAVTADLLHLLPALTTLDLTANDISLIQPQVFNSTPNLQHLDLAGENIHILCGSPRHIGFLFSVSYLSSTGG